MGETNETINLVIKSPKISLDPVDRAIEKLQQFDELLEKIARSRNIKINLGIEGGQLDGAVSNFKMLEGLLQSIGKTDWAKGLRAGMMTSGEVSQQAAMELAKVKRELVEVTLKLKENHQAWGELSKRAEISGMSPQQEKRLAEGRKALDEMEKHQRSLQDRASGLGTVAGMAKAMAGLPEANTEIAKSNANVASSATGANAALAAQGATAAKKVGVMTELAAATERAAGADMKLAAAAEMNAEAQARLIRQRVRKTQGEPDAVTNTFLTGSGQTRTISGQSVTEELDVINSAKQRFEAIKADFARRRADISSLGRQSPEMRGLLRDEATAIQGELAAGGLQGTTLFEQQRARAAGLIIQAGTGDKAAYDRALVKKAMEDRKAQIETQKKALQEAKELERARAQMKADVSDRINNAITNEMSAVRGLEQSSLKANLTDEERITVLRQLAEAYERVALAASGSGPNRDTVRNAARNRAGALRSEAAAAEERIANHEMRVQSTLASHQAAMAGFGGSAPVVSKESTSGRGAMETTRSTRTEGGMEHVLTLTRQWNAEGKEMEPILARSSRAVEDFGGSLGKLGHDFVSNLQGMAVWSAATGLLYGTIAMVSEGAATAVKLEGATTGLAQTWSRTGMEAAQLRDQVLSLAAAEGRSSEEAMQAATRWAHLHLGAQETAEAVRASLIAANNAEAEGEEGSSAGEKAKQLAAAYSAYGLEVKDLAGLLDILHGATHGLNVTQKDLLDGLDKTALMAKRAGIPLQELVAMIGVGSAATGRTGSEIGTSIDSMMGSLYRPSTQDKLQLKFGIDVKTPLGDLKQMDQILAEIYAKWTVMSRERRGEFLSDLVGKRQAASMEAILDNFGTIQDVSKKDNTGAAEAESKAMAGTLSGQWQGFKTGLGTVLALAGDAMRVASKGVDWLMDPLGLGSNGQNVLKELREKRRGSMGSVGSGLKRPTTDAENEAQLESSDRMAARQARVYGYMRDREAMAAEGGPNPRGTKYEEVMRKLDALAREEAGLRAPYPGSTDAGDVARNRYRFGGDGKDPALDQGRFRQIEIEREGLKNQLRIARMQDDFAEGSRISQRKFSAFGVGLNETERLFGEARGGASLVGDAVERNKAARGRGETGAREAAEALQLGVSLNTTQLRIEERRYAVVKDILQAKLQENQEASKALLFASRENQLRAALLAKFQRENGGGRFTNERFAYFDQSTKRAVQDYVPRLLPTGARTEVQKYEEEAALIQRGSGAVRRLTDGSIVKVGEARTNAPDTRSAGLYGNAALPPPPQINIPSVTLTFGAELKNIVDAMQQAVAAPLRAEIESIKSMLAGAVAGQGRNKAQNAGSDVIFSGD